MTKLKKRCEALRKVILSIAEVYHQESTNNDQKKLIETIIGAAIWYLPHGEDYWTEKISIGALELKRDNPKKNLSKEHEFPRKKAAEELLKYKLDEIRNNDDLLVELYEGKYAKFNYVTSSENKKVSNFQKTENFIDSEKAYREAKIQLIKVSKDELKKIKKGDKEFINNLIKNYRQQGV